MKVLLLICSLGIAAGAEYHLQLPPDSTKINWTLGDVLHTVHGTFKLKRGDIIFDPENGKAGGQVIVDTTSGESGSGARDGRMHKNVLESARYPETTFVPDHFAGKLDLNATSTIQLHGIFTIHGGAHEITVPATITAHENQMTAVIKFDLPYVAWGMKDPSTLFLKVNKAVTMEIDTTGRITAER